MEKNPRFDFSFFWNIFGHLAVVWRHLREMFRSFVCCCLCTAVKVNGSTVVTEVGTYDEWGGVLLFIFVPMRCIYAGAYRQQQMRSSIMLCIIVMVNPNYKMSDLQINFFGSATFGDWTPGFLNPNYLNTNTNTNVTETLGYMLWSYFADIDGRC